MTLFKRHILCLALLSTALLLNSCASSGRSGDGLPKNYHNFNAESIPNPTPKAEPRSRYGNPSSYEVLGKRYTVLKSAHCYHEKGIASWYGTKFHERLTSNRESYDMYAMTAANKVLPLPTYVRVHNLENGRTVIVRVNDRGPFHANRIIDLSFAAAKKIGMMAKGTAIVEVEAIDPNNPNQTCGATTARPTAMMSKPQLYLQLGAFSLKQNADQLASKVRQQTHKAVHVISVSIPAGTIYKVQIGPIKDVAESDKLTHELKANGFGEAFAAVR